MGGRLDLSVRPVFSGPHSGLSAAFRWLEPHLRIRAFFSALAAPVL